ncbi:integrator complex subunit 3 isoform X2 [Entelurus aequoreus]|uniref:integrator complex subunit 3 isoform X1 n=1 Tax=Entelurus aequoreus TaxID=161455 RepID=UPI002B1E8246|nr:integrator complex subunit 3 isoform X1 [Entelurus aequoreus]XP_061905297.1 integrator complex subunit 3 isoform X2 [Entelurus aequoreus]
MEAAPAKAKLLGRLLVSNQLDAKDELEEKLERCVGVVHALSNGLSEREANDALTANVCKGPQQHDEVCLGLFALLLTEPTQAQRCYRDLTLMNRDGMSVILVKINQILMEKFLKLQDVARKQLVWLVRELVKSSVIGADGVVMTLLKQIAGGDVSTKNLWLAESVLDILQEQKEWVVKSGMLIAMSVYTYLRLIVDHGTASLLPLRQKEVDFCISLLRDKFLECVIMGRDLVRLLQNVARITEMDLLWRDLLHNPQALSPQFTGILQLLTARTSRKFLACRLTPDMETKLLFMTSRVRFGQQKRYQDWFQRQYLSTVESQSLRCDLIRYICGVVHPSNEVLSSDILPRWAIIGWLLTTCTSNVAASNAKLALFYDWLFFNPDKDSIMNIEPAILVMHHSMKPHPAITATLLDFMCRIIPHFFPPLEVQVRQGVFNSLTFIMEKRVLAHLAPLFDNPKLDRELRSMLRERFPEFCSAPSPPMEVKMDEMTSMEMDNHMMDKEEGCYDNAEAAFSDDEEEVNNKGKKREFRFHPIREVVKEEPADITPWLDQLEDTMKDKVVQLQKSRSDWAGGGLVTQWNLHLPTRDTETQCEVMQDIVDLILEDDFDTEQMSALASCLAEVFKEHFRGDVLPEDITDESLEESVCKAVCLVFRNLVTMQEDNSGFSVLLDMLAELYQKQPKIGYHLLYYLKASKAANGKMMLYESFAQATALGDLHTCLMMDMKACQEDDVRLLCYLTPSIYSEFPDETLRSGELLNMIVAVIDSTQLQELMCHVMMGNLVMFRKDSVLNILIQSLDWETFEQYSTWQLFLAHSIPLETIIGILQHLKYKEHPEALSCLLLQLRREKPSEEMVKMVLSRPCHSEDQFTSSLLRHWASKHDDTLAEHIKTQLIKNNNQPRKRQSLRSSSSKLAQLTLEQILEHLDNLRLSLTNTKNNFFSQTPILQALQHVQASCDEVHKMRFSELFALAEEYEDSQAKPLKSRRKAAATSPRSRKGVAPPTNEEESASSSASEEEDSKPKAPKRKRKGSSAVGSDSD